MALKLLQAGGQPLGQFDGFDGETLLGGEVVSFRSVTNTAATDKSAADSADGYLYPGTLRTTVSKVLSSAAGTGPLMLADEGTSGYGTLFGTVVGGTVGKVVTGGAVLGPATQTGSGKVTCWHQPGLYAVTLDAVDLTVLTGLQVTNPSLTAGSKLYAIAASGLLTPNASQGSLFNSSNVVGHFVEFDTDRGLVNTPNRLVAATNSPGGAVAGSLAQSYTVATFHFNPSN